MLHFLLRLRFGQAAWVLVCLLGGWLSAASTYAQPTPKGNPYLKTVRIGGVSEGSGVSSALVDRNGFLVVGTPDGVARFDGRRWRLIPTDGEVTALAEVPSGTTSSVWVASRNRIGKLTRTAVTKGFLRYRELAAVDGQAVVQRLLVADEGKVVYAVSSSGLFAIANHDSTTAVRIAPPADTAQFQGAVLHKGVLYAAWDQRLVPVRGQKPGAPLPDSLGAGRIVFSTDYNQSSTLVGMSDGRLLIFDGNSLYAFATPDQEFLKRSEIYTGLYLGLNRFAVGTSEGCFVFNRDKRIEHIVNIQAGLANNAVRALTKDDAGGLWIGHDGGLARLFEGFGLRDFAVYTGMEGNIQAVAWHQNRLYAGTTGGVYLLEEKSDSTTIETAETYRNTQLKRLWDEAEDDLQRLARRLARKQKSLAEITRAYQQRYDRIYAEQKRAIETSRRMSRKQKSEAEKKRILEYARYQDREVTKKAAADFARQETLAMQEARKQMAAEIEARLDALVADYHARPKSQPLPPSYLSKFAYRRVPGVGGSCHELVVTPQGDLLAATSTGLYRIYKGKGYALLEGDVNDIDLNPQLPGLVVAATADGLVTLEGPKTAAAAAAERAYGNATNVAGKEVRLRASLRSVTFDGQSPDRVWVVTYDGQAYRVQVRGGRASIVDAPAGRFRRGTQLLNWQGRIRFVRSDSTFAYDGSKLRYDSLLTAYVRGGGAWKPLGRDAWMGVQGRYLVQVRAGASNTIVTDTVRQFAVLANRLQAFTFDNPLKPRALWVAAGGRIVQQSLTDTVVPRSDRFRVQLLRATTDADSTGNLETYPIFSDQRFQDSYALRFDFAAPSFDDSTSVEYRYRLRGSSAEGWSPWSLQPYASFPGLTGGRYTLEVEARNALGQVAVPLRYEFALRQTLWDYVKDWRYFIPGLLVLLVVGGLLVKYFFDRQQRRHLEKERALQAIIDARTAEAKRLLHNILPKSIADELEAKRLEFEQGRAKIVQEYDRVTVLFTDFKGFTQISESMTPEQLVEELNQCFGAFDGIVRNRELTKIKTIGDAYMAAGGIPEPNASHAVDAVLAGLDMQRFLEKERARRAAEGKPYWELRLGIHTGPVVAGVIGQTKFAYDLWGDTVNTASRMESSGEVGQVNISKATYEAVEAFFDCVHRGQVAAKNKGLLDMYTVRGIRAELSEGGKGETPNDQFRARRAALLDQPAAAEAKPAKPRRNRQPAN